MYASFKCKAWDFKKSFTLAKDIPGILSGILLTLCRWVTFGE